MYRKYLLLPLICMFAVLVNVSAEEEKKMETRTIYFFGVAKNYSDSLTYMTDIMAIPNVAMDKETGAIANMEFYSEQLNNYLKASGKSGYVCALFTEKSQKKIEKKYMKMKKHFKKDISTRVESMAFKYEYVDPSTIYRNVVDETKTPENQPTE